MKQGVITVTAGDSLVGSIANGALTSLPALNFKLQGKICPIT